MYCKSQSHNWQLHLNETGLAICVQVFDWSTTVRNVFVIADNTMSKSKAVLEMTATGLTHPERRRRHWSSLAHSVLMRCFRSSISVMHVFTPCIAVFPKHFSQLDLNPANLEATVEAEWILAFLFLQKRHFSMTSQLRHHYVVSCKYWWDILHFFSHTYSQYDSCQKLWKVV